MQYLKMSLKNNINYAILYDVSNLDSADYDLRPSLKMLTINHVRIHFTYKDKNYSVLAEKKRMFFILELSIMPLCLVNT